MAPDHLKAVRAPSKLERRGPEPEALPQPNDVPLGHLALGLPLVLVETFILHPAAALHLSAPDRDFGNNIFDLLDLGAHFGRWRVAVELGRDDPGLHALARGRD